MATNEANQKQMASDIDIAIATAYGYMHEARRRSLGVACMLAMRDIDSDTNEKLVANAIKDYNRAWRELTGLPNHWEDGPYTADNMPEIPKVPTSCTGVGPYDDADALAQLNS